MGNLTQLIELYETKGVDEVLKEERLWSNLEELKQELEAKEPEEREALEVKFQNLLDDLAKNVEEISKEMQTASDRMDSSKKSVEACIQYTKASIGPDTGRKKG